MLCGWRLYLLERQADMRVAVVTETFASELFPTTSAADDTFEFRRLIWDLSSHRWTTNVSNTIEQGSSHNKYRPVSVWIELIRIFPILGHWLLPIETPMHSQYIHLSGIGLDRQEQSKWHLQWPLWITRRWVPFSPPALILDLRFLIRERLLTEYHNSWLQELYSRILHAQMWVP